MANEMNTFELTDEQLETVVGGDGNGATINQYASANQVNVAIGEFKNSSVGGSPTILQYAGLSQSTKVKKFFHFED